MEIKATLKEYDQLQNIMISACYACIQDVECKDCILNHIKYFDMKNNIIEDL